MIRDEGWQAPQARTASTAKARRQSRQNRGIPVSLLVAGDGDGVRRCVNVPEPAVERRRPRRFSGGASPVEWSGRAVASDETVRTISGMEGNDE
jgi:hypothetical protein